MPAVLNQSNRFSKPTYPALEILGDASEVGGEFFSQHLVLRDVHLTSVKDLSDATLSVRVCVSVCV